MLFVHGLSGHITKTWTSTGEIPSIWPKWLSLDLPGIGVWSVGYAATKTNWSGFAMRISDRGDNVLARLLTEPRLRRGNIIFVGHSLGGLVIEQVLRSALRDANENPDAERLLKRVKRVAFLGTPHRGALFSTIAKILSLVVRPSSATNDLGLEDAGLRDLNYWYRAYSRDSGIETLVLAEGRSQKIFGIPLPGFIGTIVSPSSSDPGLPTPPIMVDADHVEICKPQNRDAEVYVLLKRFIAKPFNDPPKGARIVEAVEQNTTELQQLTFKSEEQTNAIIALQRTIASVSSPIAPIDSALSDKESMGRLSLIRRSRLFQGYDAPNEARKLTEALTSGELAGAANSTKSIIFAWCARFLSVAFTDEAEKLLTRVDASQGELSIIARAFITSAKGDISGALGMLASINSSASRSAAYIILLTRRGPEDADEWMRNSSLSHIDFDSDGKLFKLKMNLEREEWESALSLVQELTEADFIETPALVLLAADTHLVQAVPLQLRTDVLELVPFDAVNFPLSIDSTAFKHRRMAMRLFERMRDDAKALNLGSIVSLADDKALWLGLRDPDCQSQTRADLEESMRKPELFLRRMTLAIQFGIDVDLIEAEREVDRQTALSGGNSPDAALARFGLAFTKKDPSAVVDYLEKHRQQLLAHFAWQPIFFLEIEMLARSGQTDRAEVRLREAISKGLSIEERNRLEKLIEEERGGDPIVARLGLYEASGSITDLRNLVISYEEKKNWQKTAEFGKKLFDLTNDVVEARRYANALYHTQQLNEIIELFEKYPILLTQSSNLRILECQCLYELGRLNDASVKLKNIQKTEDLPNARWLQINIAIASGDWESLQIFVEKEWEADSDRTPQELLRAGQIAQLIGSSRGKQLIQAAAQRAPEDPTILLGCYHAATEAGWESSDEVAAWFQAAIRHSNEEGPVQSVSIEELLERSPSWERREFDVWKSLAIGEVPIFMAADFLHRSLLSLTLFPALANAYEGDVRKKSMVYAFSGSRGRFNIEPKILGMDVTALLTAEMLEIFPLYLATFEKILIPHNTLGWLLTERAKILFHQPSRVVKARELRQLLNTRALRPFEGTAVPPESLIAEVGDTLASLLAEAAAAKDNEKARIVVRGRPVHRLNSLMKEEADLGAFAKHLCSCRDVIEKLVQRGVLTAPEAESCREWLDAREEVWPNSQEIADGAILYLDDLAVSHFEFLGILPKLHLAGITAIISTREIKQADDLIDYDKRAADVVVHVEKLRMSLRDGLNQGKVSLGNLIRVEDGNEDKFLGSHPTMAIMEMIVGAEAVIVDDRFVNQHANISSNSHTVPVLSTLDVLDILRHRNSVPMTKWFEARTTLRRNGYILVPIDAAELGRLIASASIADGALNETAELKGLRENVIRLRMSDVLQIPKEASWLISLVDACVSTLKNQWTDMCDENEAAARSDWLLNLADVRPWAHRFNETPSQSQARFLGFVHTLLFLPTTQSSSVKSLYWRWLESRLLRQISEEDTAGYTLLVNHVKMLIEDWVEASNDDEEEHGNGAP
ncbi:MAG: HNH endonuclease [Proteobacteria bacterium]|nr:HNH endonuclease [Pseudomonadota bacterium]